MGFDIGPNSFYLFVILIYFSGPKVYSKFLTKSKKAPQTDSRLIRTPKLLNRTKLTPPKSWLKIYGDNFILYIIFTTFLIIISFRGFEFNLKNPNMYFCVKQTKIVELIKFSIESMV